MILEKSIKVEITSIKRKGFIKKLLNINNEDINIGDIFYVKWDLLCTSSLRRTKIKMKCDDCGKEYYKPIRFINKNNKVHFCNSCRQRAERHHNFGKPMHPNSKKALIKSLTGDNNPSKRPEVRIKLSISAKKHPSNMLNKHHTKEGKNNIRKGVLKAIESGKYIPHKIGFPTPKLYKNLPYLSSYELNFLKYLEKHNKLNIIEQGPIVPYIDKNGKQHNYLIDYKLKNTNTVFEVKSTYFLNKNFETYILKESAAKKLYNYYLILDNNFEELNELLQINNK